MKALRTVVVLVLALALPAHVLAADLQAGWDAYHRGDYATALEELRPLAEQGDASAHRRKHRTWPEGHSSDNHPCVGGYG